MEIEFREQVCGKRVADASTEDVRIERTLRQCDAIKFVARFKAETSCRPDVNSEIEASARAIVEIAEVQRQPPCQSLVSLRIQRDAVVRIVIFARWDDNAIANLKILVKEFKFSADTNTTPTSLFQFQPGAPDKRSRFQLIV